MKKTIISFMRVFVSLFLILILLYIMRDKYGLIAGILKNTSLPIFLLGFLVFIGAITVASLRLKIVIGAQKIQVTFPEALSLTFLGYFFNNFLPTAIGGDVAKAYYLARKSKVTLGSFAAVFVDRLIGLVTMIFMAFVALFFTTSETIDNSVKLIIYAITAISALAIFLMTNKKIAKRFSAPLFFLKPIEHKLKNIYNAVHLYKDQGAVMLRSLAISVISQMLFFLSLGVLAVSIGSHIPVIDIFLKMPIISALSLLPSINGLGLREGSTVIFFGPIIGKENAFAVSILWLLVLLITSLIGGIIYGLSPQFKMKLKDIEEKEAII